MLREPYTTADFDFALAYIEDLDVFYIFPVEVFISYGSGIHLVEADRRQRKPQSADYRDAWDFITDWAATRKARINSATSII